MNIKKTNEFEKVFCKILNEFNGWQLKWVGDKNLCYDLKGITPKGRKCVIELKFRKKYYKAKMIEKYKYDRLMKLDKDIVKIYFVSDPGGSYYFWLDKLTDLKIIEKDCPTTTYWNDDKIKKNVYLLDEDLASVIHKTDNKTRIINKYNWYDKKNRKPKRS
tara:strand:+ start:1523 stop:2005 length:483 start_codon:yes stop_codon:yes gene_type:complete